MQDLKVYISLMLEMLGVQPPLSLRLHIFFLAPCCHEIWAFQEWPVLSGGLPVQSCCQRVKHRLCPEVAEEIVTRQNTQPQSGSQWAAAPSNNSFITAFALRKKQCGPHSTKHAPAD